MGLEHIYVLRKKLDTTKTHIKQLIEIGETEQKNMQWIVL